MYKFILEKRMTLTSLFSLYFMQFWMAFAYQRAYPQSLFIAKCCPDGSCVGAAEMIGWFFGDILFEFLLPIIILIIVTILVSKEVGLHYKFKWIFMSFGLEIIFYIFSIILILPLP